VVLKIDEQRIAHNRRTIEHWAPIVSRQAIGNQLLFRREAGRIFPAEKLMDVLDFAKPVIVCGAGPSLKDTIDIILERKIRDRFTMIAVDTALKPLLRRGVVPNLVVTLDPEGNLLEATFRDCAEYREIVHFGKCALMAPSFAHRKLLRAWLDTFNRPVYIYNPLDQSNPAYEKLRQLYPRVPCYPSKPNVGQFSIDWAYSHGAEVIAFAGLDLAYPAGQGYVDGVGHASTGLPADATLTLLDNAGNPVMTSHTLFYDHLSFVDLVRAHYCERRLFNLSRGIVPMVNATKDFFEEFGNVSRG